MIRIAVDTITCRAGGEVLAQKVWLVDDDEVIDIKPTPCSPAFAQAECSVHSAPPPDLDVAAARRLGLTGGLRYSDPPLLWERRHYHVRLGSRSGDNPWPHVPAVG